MGSVVDRTPASIDQQEETAATVSGALKTPIAPPSPTTFKIVGPVLTSDEQSKYDELLGQVRAWTEVKCGAASADKSGPLTDSERQWLTRECLLRYLRATKWNTKEAERRLRETITWRREYGVEALTAEHISPENETGKQIILGFDNDRRPCHYLNPGRQNTPQSPRQVQHLVFMLERVIELMPAGQEKLTILINYKSSTFKSRFESSPSLSLSREVLHILQTYYPERLGRSFIVNAPWVLNGVFKLLTPLMDPATREKLKFNVDMPKYVPEDQLWAEYSGGKLEFEYDHAAYWPALNAMCKERRDAQTERWVAGGKHIGEFEDYLKAAVESGVGASVDVADARPAAE